MMMSDPRVFRSGRVLLVRRGDLARLVTTGPIVAPAMPLDSVAAHAVVALPWREISRDDPDFASALAKTSDSDGWNPPDFLD